MLRIRWFILLLLAALALAPGSPSGVGAQPAADDEPYLVEPTAPKEVGEGVVEITLGVTTRRRLPLAPDVPMPTSLVRMLGKAQLDSLLEEGLLESLYRVDLDGDGSLGQLPVRLKDGVLRIDQMRVEPLTTGPLAPQRPYREDGKPKVYRFSPDAPQFMVLFYEPPMMGIALEHHNVRPSVERFPNPTLQVLVFEPCGVVSGKQALPDDPSFQVALPGLEGGSAPEQHLLFAWEPWLFGRLQRDPQWLRGYWVALPVSPEPGRRDYTFRVQTTRDTLFAGLMAQVNYAVEPGVRLRTAPIVGRLRQAPVNSGREGTPLAGAGPRTAHP